jgi:hypothetical protein
VIFNMEIMEVSPAGESSYRTEHRAAIITYVWTDTFVNLKVFGKDHNETDAVFTSSTLGHGKNQWSWPERV